MDFKYSLIYYSRTGKIDIVNKLLTSPKINIDSQDRYNNTALMYASRHGYSNIVQKLLECKADGNIQGENNSTALIWASRNIRPDVVQLLIQYKASYHLQDNNDLTALKWAYNIKCFNCIIKTQRIIKMLKDYESKHIRESISSNCPHIYTDIVELIVRFIL